MFNFLEIESVFSHCYTSLIVNEDRTGNDLLSPSSEPKSHRKINSCVAAKKAAASNSAVGFATVDCSFEFQLIAP